MQRGQPAHRRPSFDQVFDFEPAQGQPVALAEIRQSLHGFGGRAVMDRFVGDIFATQILCNTEIVYLRK